jgi:ABC-type uncharacterized transport system ATPase subunit
VEQFSGGMKRRCNLIAGTLHNPKVLFWMNQPLVLMFSLKSDYRLSFGFK